MMHAQHEYMNMGTSRLTTLRVPASLIFFNIIFIPSLHKTLFFQKEFKLLSEQFITYLVADHTAYNLLLFVFDSSTCQVTIFWALTNFSGE